ncbi:HAD-IB family hydrolase [Jatrophihabitans sp. DSM 44399]|uniref:HAD-IB family hydrolase n=1 Tax=Jatrophihabitans lederbergiae TaxID=3075547 RepID=A0ABU2J8K2_9ACTN|nr:HAD-IB family hydrolase [Jatrophihabitans sp. DSM 44399]MDT0260964.1 HAD-IB family hydrolase [Jatrophihabitans sp. DSM 44399]
MPSRSAGAAAREVEDALRVPARAEAAAFFDVDNTMVVGASIFHFAKGLAARKHFSTKDLRRFVWQQVKFRAGGEGAEDIARARESALAFVAGKPVAEIVAMSEEIYDEVIAAKVYSGTRALAQLHLDAGERVWLVTATPEDLAKIIATRLGVTGAIGTRAEERDGLFTGRLIGELLHGEAKAAAVRDLAVRECLDLAQCAAYSDSINDLPMLSLVGRPVAVNPDSALQNEARRRGWEIRDFRTGRKAARIGIPTALAVSTAGGAVASGIAIRRRQERARQAGHRRR